MQIMQDIIDEKKRRTEVELKAMRKHPKRRRPIIFVLIFVLKSKRSCDWNSRNPRQDITISIMRSYLHSRKSRGDFWLKWKN
jgi:hypothetical protein